MAAAARATAGLMREIGIMGSLSGEIDPVYQVSRARSWAAPSVAAPGFSPGGAMLSLGLIRTTQPTHGGALAPEPSNTEASNPSEAATDGGRLYRSLLHGVAWTGALKWASQVVSWAVMIYVARRLEPSDFGLVAMASVAIGLARMVDDLGLDAAIVQDRGLGPVQMSRLGGLALVLGVTFAVLFAAMSVPISRFFHEPAVVGIVCVLAISFLTDALQVVPRALLQRDLEFRRLAWVQGIQVLVTTACAAALAALGFGYWTLVWNSVLGGIAATALPYAWRPHPIAWPRELRTVSRAITFGSHLLLSRIAWYGYSNIDSTLVGRVLGKAALGAYTLSLTFATIPVTEVSFLVGRVVPGVFSTVQGERRGLRRYFLMLTEAISYVTLPATL